jgi:hypothetical protein
MLLLPPPTHRPRVHIRGGSDSAAGDTDTGDFSAPATVRCRRFHRILVRRRSSSFVARPSFLCVKCRRVTILPAVRRRASIGRSETAVALECPVLCLRVPRERRRLVRNASRRLSRPRMVPAAASVVYRLPVPNQTPVKSTSSGLALPDDGDDAIAQVDMRRWTLSSVSPPASPGAH